MSGVWECGELLVASVLMDAIAVITHARIGRRESDSPRHHQQTCEPSQTILIPYGSLSSFSGHENLQNHFFRSKTQLSLQSNFRPSHSRSRSLVLPQAHTIHLIDKGRQTFNATTSSTLPESLQPHHDENKLCVDAVPTVLKTWNDLLQSSDDDNFVVSEPFPRHSELYFPDTAVDPKSLEHALLQITEPNASRHRDGPSSLRSELDGSDSSERGRSPLEQISRSSCVITPDDLKLALLQLTEITADLAIETSHGLENENLPEGMSSDHEDPEECIESSPGPDFNTCATATCCSTTLHTSSSHTVHCYIEGGCSHVTLHSEAVVPSDTSQNKPAMAAVTEQSPISRTSTDPQLIFYIGDDSEEASETYEEKNTGTTTPVSQDVSRTLENAETTPTPAPSTTFHADNTLVLSN